MTLSNNIDIISDSLDDIKDAIIAKGVTPSGNITTYATAVENIGKYGGLGYTFDDCTITETGVTDLLTGDSISFFNGATKCRLTLRPSGNAYYYLIGASIYTSSIGYVQLCVPDSVSSSQFQMAVQTYDNTTGTLSFDFLAWCPYYTVSGTERVPQGRITIQSDTLKNTFSDIRKSRFQ